MDRELLLHSRSADLADWRLSIEGNQVALFDRINRIFQDLQGLFVLSVPSVPIVVYRS